MAWHPAQPVPAGTRHGANGWCLTDDGGVVLISTDGERWGWPGGRPEGAETWEETFRREVLEEACAVVQDARLLGFSRARCLSGPENGLILVRSIWRATVELLEWKPDFEVAFRKVIRQQNLWRELWMEPGFEPLYARGLVEAELL